VGGKGLTLVRFLYLIYGLIVLLGSTLYNFSATVDTWGPFTNDSATGSSSWSSSGSGRSGWSSSGGGGHK
jgi:hypothetical protein